jgi:HK97 family phage prohead protease
MNRAYAVLEIKSVNDGERVIRGVATTPTPDRMGDVVDPMGVTYKNPLALLWQHQADQPVGTVKFDKPTKDGITFEATIANIDEPGTLKDRLDEAWQSVKTGLVRAVSIGFRALEYSFMDEGGIRFIASEVLELSLVTIPANADATITQIRSIDAETLALSGKEQPAEADLTGAKLVPAAPAAKAVHVAKLSAPARDRAEPFVIRKIRHNR